MFHHMNSDLNFGWNNFFLFFLSRIKEMGYICAPVFEGVQRCNWSGFSHLLKEGEERLIGV